MKTYTLNEVQDKLIGQQGTPERDRFEYELQMELIGQAINGDSPGTQFNPGRAGQTYWCPKIPDIDD